MRVAIDATSVPRKPAGAGVYAIELVRALARLGRRDGYALFARGDWPNADLAGLRNWRIEGVAATTRPGRLAWEQVRLPRRLTALGIDVLHSTHHTLPLVPADSRRVVTIHDVTFFRIPERYPPARRFYMQTLTRLAARIADGIIVPSNAVRDEVVATLHVPQSKVTTVYEAAAARFAPVAEDVALAVARDHGIEGPYVVSVGSLEPGKNRGRLIRAMSMLRDAGSEHRLVVIGQRAWHYQDDIELLEALGMRGRVLFLGYVDGQHLVPLYCGATACALPSLHEGFGLPVLEAMACGVPVLTSNVSATAEVAGDAAVLVDPLSVDNIRDGLRRLLQDEQLRAHLRARGLQRAAQFSWARAAGETHDVYERVTAGRQSRS